MAKKPRSRSVLNDNEKIVASGDRTELDDTAMKLEVARLESIAKKLRTASGDSLAKGASYLLRADSAHLPPVDFQNFTASARSVIQNRKTADDLDKQAQKLRRTLSFSITNEPRVYGGSIAEAQVRGTSYLKDTALVAARCGDSNQIARAQERLNRYGAELRTVSPGSAEGRYLTRSLRDNDRREERALSTGSVSAGSFTPPAYLMELFATYRLPFRAFANVCRSVPMPDHGMVLEIPAFTGPNSTAADVENATVSDTDATATYLSTPVTTAAGSLKISQQIFDRADPNGFDVYAIAQLAESAGASIDGVALAAALGSTQAGVSDSTAFSTTQLWADASLAAQQILLGTGVRFRATHLVLPSAVFTDATSQIGSDGRPVWAVAFSTQNTTDDTATGYVGPAGLSVITDDNIPTASGNFQILVSRPDVVCLAEGSPLTFAFTETAADHLQVVIGLRQYVGAISRFAAHSVVSGSTYVSSIGAP